MIQFKTQTERNEWGGVSPVLQIVVYVLGIVYTALAGKALVITSVVSGPHSPTGLHPKARAVDMRSKEAPAPIAEKFFAVLELVGKALGGQVFWEDRGTANEHWHFGL